MGATKIPKQIALQKFGFEGFRVSLKSLATGLEFALALFALNRQLNQAI